MLHVTRSEEGGLGSNSESGVVFLKTAIHRARRNKPGCCPTRTQPLLSFHSASFPGMLSPDPSLRPETLFCLPNSPVLVLLPSGYPSHPCQPRKCSHHRPHRWLPVPIFLLWEAFVRGTRCVACPPGLKGWRAILQSAGTPLLGSPAPDCHLRSVGAWRVERGTWAFSLSFALPRSQQLDASGHICAFLRPK